MKTISIVTVFALYKPVQKIGQEMYCTPKVGHFWGVFYEI